jgi:hypothetical protein
MTVNCKDYMNVMPPDVTPCGKDRELLNYTVSTAHTTSITITNFMMQTPY